MPTDTQHPHSSEQQQMHAVVIQASGPPAQSLAYRPGPGPGAGAGSGGGARLRYMQPG
jgi:hypothetical protein